MSAERFATAAKSKKSREASEVLAALCRDQHDQLVRLALGYTKDESRAKEVVQEVYRRVVREPRGLLEADDRCAYARQAIRREAAHVNDRAASEREALDAFERESVRAPPPTPEQERRVRALKAAVRKAVASLPSRQCEAITLVKLQQMSHKETAEVMGCATSTVKVHLRSGLKALRRLESLRRIADTL